MEKHQSQTDRLSLAAAPMPRSSKMAIVGIVAVLHLWVFAALALMKPVQPEPKPMSVSFVSRSAEVAGAAGGAEAVQQDQSGESVAATAQANPPTEPASPDELPTITNIDETLVSPDQPDMNAPDQQPVNQPSLAADSAAQTSPSTQPKAMVETDDQLINLDVLNAVNSTLQKQSGAQREVDRALEQISSVGSKKPVNSDLAANLSADDEQQPTQSGGQIASKNSNPFPGIDTACPAFLHQLPASEQYELVGSGCTSGQVQGCELKFDQVGVKNFPAFDAQSGIFQGEAVLSFTVDAKGNPGEVELLAATTRSMARSALQFLATSQFVPLKDSSRCGPYALPVRFSLYD